MSGIAIIISIALREVVFQFQYRQYRKSSENQSNSYIEMHRNSLLSSVVVLIGVFGSMAGQALEIPIMLYIDPVAALVVACLVLWRGCRLIFGAIYGKYESKVPEEDRSQFIETVQRVHGVITVDELKLRDSGHYISVTATISVNPRITVLEANHIANRAKILLLNRFSQVSEVSIQVMPYDPGYPYKSNYEGSNNDMPTLLQ
ncbi:ferrous iron efflux protein F [compost metagenome]